MDVIYYYCYLFYTKIIKDNEPYATTVWALGFSEGFFASIILNIVSIHFWCFSLDKWKMIGIGIMFLLGNYFYFNKSGKAKKIVKIKPMFCNNHRISIILTIIFFAVLISSMFWGPIYTRYLLDEHCR